MEPGSTSFVTTMLHEIKATLRGEPHTFTEIRRMLEDSRANGTHLIDIFHEHHRFLNESIVVLLDHDSTREEKQLHLTRFLRLFEMHAHAEEETLYRKLRLHASHEVVREGLVGRDEHDIAFRLVADLRALDFETHWSDDADAKTKVLANLVHHHLKEEEKVMFPLARKSLQDKEFHELTTDYLDLCEFYLDGEREPVPSFMVWSLNT